MYSILEHKCTMSLPIRIFEITTFLEDPKALGGRGPLEEFSYNT